jgi:4-hydroxybenzoate polyprenyltransferase
MINVNNLASAVKDKLDYLNSISSKLLGFNLPFSNQIKILLSLPALAPYVRLMRLDKPTGIWLLLWPCFWGITAASERFPSIKLLLIFAIGSVIMRGAGCIINDIIDRNIDNKVERTKNRPIASGKLSVTDAMFFLCFLLLIALGLLLLLNKTVIIIGLFSVILVITYPFMKRITYWPQAFLGLTFNIGALMGYAAVTGELGFGGIYLYLAGFFWTLGYDTIYAHQDKKDDEIIGVKSSAIKLGDNTNRFLWVMYAALTFLLLITGPETRTNFLFYLIILKAAYNLYWQITTLNINDPADCAQKFRANVSFGGTVFLAFLIGKLF